MTDALTPFDAQVGGHSNTLQSDASDSSILIKHTCAREVDFYQSLCPLLAPDLLGTWTPKFYGTLNSTSQTLLPDESDAVALAHKVGVEDTPDALVMENLCCHFVKPNIIDFKLGKQLWDPDSSTEKRERMTKAAANTTSGAVGLRLTACQIWNASTESYRETTKVYGKSLTVPQLPEALQRAFPVCTSTSTSEGLPASHLAAVLKIIRARIAAYLERFERIPWRIYGSSLLVIYEGHLPTLEESLQSTTEGLECELELDEDDVGGDDEDDGEEEEEERKYACTVKAIDFAHAWDAQESQDGDAGYTEGLRTLLRLVEGRLEEVQQAL